MSARVPAMFPGSILKH